MTKQTLEKFSKLFVKLEHEDKQAGEAGEGGSSQRVRGMGVLFSHICGQR